jgi:hypothetical protein
VRRGASYPGRRLPTFQGKTLQYPGWIVCNHVRDYTASHPRKHNRNSIISARMAAERGIALWNDDLSSLHDDTGQRYATTKFCLPVENMAVGKLLCFFFKFTFKKI